MFLHKCLRVFTIISTGLLCMLLVSTSSAASRKLSGTMPMFGDIERYEISPDGRYVVYEADQDTDRLYELYSVPADGSAAPVKLNPPLEANGRVFNFVISPNSERVVYLATQDTAIDLYSVPIEGSAAPTKLNPPLPLGGRISIFLVISADSRRVVYAAEQETDNVQELYSVPIDGSAAPIKLNAPLPPGGNVGESFRRNIAVSPDSKWVVYGADGDTDEVFELYSVPIDGSASPTKFEPSSVVGLGSIWTNSFQITPDSRHVVYLANPEPATGNALYSTPIDGSAPPTRLTPPHAANKNIISLRISPNSRQVIYQADHEIDTVLELYSVPIDGSVMPIKLNDTLTGTSDVFNFSISPDSRRVVYRADAQEDKIFDLYSAPLDGNSSSVKLNPPLVTGGRVSVRFLTTPDSTRVVYLADQQTDEDYNLYSVPLDGSSAPVELTQAYPSNGVGIFRLSPDGHLVVHINQSQANDAFELYSVPIDGNATSTKVSGPVVENGFVYSFQISRDSQRVIYRAEGETDDVYELYAADLGPRTVGFAAVSISASEDAGIVALDVVLNAPVLADVTVDYAATGGSATSGADYTLAAGQVTIPTGAITATLDLAIADDALVESDETVVLTLNNPQEASLAATSSLTLTITDNDSALTPTPPYRMLRLPLLVR